VAALPVLGEADRVLDAVGEPMRRVLLRRLRAGPRPVADLARDLPVTRPAVSQHLKVLLDAGLVSFERAGTRNVYRLRPEGLAPRRRWVEDLWDTALAAYAAEAERIARDRAAPTPGWTEPDGA
jgi:DNA-binding transcriptional ArsR family regulator